MNQNPQNALVFSRRGLAVVAGVLWTSTSVHGQELVPSHVEPVNGKVEVVFASKPRMSYSVSHTPDLTEWAPYPETLTGTGQEMRFEVLATGESGVNFAAKAKPLSQFFRVYESHVDANLDGVPDDAQSQSDAVDNDLDDDGIPNSHDQGRWPASSFPQLNSLLGNVMINEVLMSNTFGIKEDSNQPFSSDWVELYNPTTSDIDLTGWFLSDSAGNAGRRKWTFPIGTKIRSGKFLVIWASGLNRGGKEDVNGNGLLDPGEDFDGDGVLDSSKPIHTSFRFEGGDLAESPPKTPEPVVLSRPNPAGGAIIVDSLVFGGTPNFGYQKVDYSFGRYPSPDGLRTGYLYPTPGVSRADGYSGQHNGQGANAFTDPPTFAPESDPPGLYEDTTVTAVLLPPASGIPVYYTTNSANPTPFSDLYAAPVKANRTKIIRAIAVKPGCFPSPSVTRSYLFKEDILGTRPQGETPVDQQGARDQNGEFKGLLRGYPENSEVAGYPIKYGMHPDVVKAKKDTLRTELSAVPVVSIVSSVPELFDLAQGGIYPNSGKSDDYWTGRGGSDPKARDWERLCSFEFCEPDKSDYTQANACLSMTGGSSLYQDVTAKHNFRVKLDPSHGPKHLIYPLFGDNPVVKYTSFHLKNPSDDSWAMHKGREPRVAPFREWRHLADSASYCDEAWMRSAQRLMGHENPRRRWVQLFLNGIYWGPYELTERVDSDYIKRRGENFDNATFDVLKQRSDFDPPNINGVTAIEGTTVAWDILVGLCNGLNSGVSQGRPASELAFLYTDILSKLDIENYIDYLLCYAYAHGSDWPKNNFRIARTSNLLVNKFRFFVWDSEWSFQPTDYLSNAASRLVGNLNVDGRGGVAQPHTLLRSYGPYRVKFSERVQLHYFRNLENVLSGNLSLHQGKDECISLFEAEANLFKAILYGESARWGNSQREVPFTFVDLGYLSSESNKGDWSRTVNHIMTTWMPQRRERIFKDFANANLFVAVIPIGVSVPRLGFSYTQSLNVIGGMAPHSLRIISGRLPSGLVLDELSIRGVPNLVEATEFSIGAYSSEGIQGVTNLTLTVNP